MILQADTPVRLWGWADAGHEVQVRLGDRGARCVADDRGAWSCTIAAFPVGLELTLSVTSGGEAVEVSDILTGEVWLCAGQSNMEMEVDKTNQLQDACRDADYPGIRCFTVAHARSIEPVEDCEGAWKVCTPQSVGGFSGVAFHFARQIHKDLRVPVGIVVCAVGATSVKQWASRDLLRTFPQFADLVKQSYGEVPGPCVDPGITPPAASWHDPVFDDSAWRTVDLPAPWYGSGLDFNGAAWFRRRFDVPASWVGGECVLSLGRINDFDVTFVNGSRVGATGSETPWWWNAPRHYRVPPGTLRERGNVVAVRVFNQWDDGGFSETEKDRMRVEGPAGAPVPLNGEWRCSAEVKFTARRVTTAQPCGHYNAMIAPLLNFRLRGFAWYQGENDIAFVEDHRTLFPALISDWRAKWGGGDLPFLFVQLPKYQWPSGQAGDGCLPFLREAQAQALALPNTGMAVALDAGEAHDVHPQNKRDVGIRLGLVALDRVYGRAVESQGPTLDGMRAEGGRIRVRLSHAMGLHARGEMQGFEVAGEDRRFHPARAVIEGGDVVVSSDAVPAPVAVRYAWSDCPPHPLYNAAGLPAAPFRSDGW